MTKKNKMKRVIGDVEKNPISSAAELEERFYQDEFHWHFGDSDVCSEELAIKYLLIKRIESLFAFHERLDRFSWDNNSKEGDWWETRRQIEVLEYLLKDAKERLKEDLECSKKDIARFEKGTEKKLRKL